MRLLKFLRSKRRRSKLLMAAKASDLFLQKDKSANARRDRQMNLIEWDIKELCNPGSSSERHMNAIKTVPGATFVFYFDSLGNGIFAYEIWILGPTKSTHNEPIFWYSLAYKEHCSKYPDLFDKYTDNPHDFVIRAAKSEVGDTEYDLLIESAKRKMGGS